MLQIFTIGKIIEIPNTSKIKANRVCMHVCDYARNISKVNQKEIKADYNESVKYEEFRHKNQQNVISIEMKPLISRFELKLPSFP